MLLGTLDASLLANLLTGRGVNKKRKWMIRAEDGVIKSKKQGREINKKGKGIIRAEKDLWELIIKIRIIIKRIFNAASTFN